MGKNEDIVLDYLSQPEVFAALFNGYVFGGKQIIQSGAFRLIPTITLVFYTGQEKWDAATELKELYEGSPYLEEMLPFLLSVPLNIISVYDVQDTEKYHGSLRKVFELLHYVDDGAAMLSYVKEHEEVYSKLDEATMRLLSVLIHLEFPERESEEEDDDMCKALEDIKQMGITEGKDSILLTMLAKGMTCEEISDLTGMPIERVKQVEAGSVVIG